LPTRIHAISSPRQVAFQPGKVGSIMARLVLPQALGNAAERSCFLPREEVRQRMSMCSAIQPSFFATTDAMRSARHFLPSSALPPYPEPYDQIEGSSGKCTMYFFCG